MFSKSSQGKVSQPKRVLGRSKDIPKSKEGAERKSTRGLNEAMLKWMEKQSHQNPYCSWKEGIRDYIKYSSALQKELKHDESDQSGGNGVMNTPETNDEPPSSSMRNWRMPIL